MEDNEDENMLQNMELKSDFMRNQVKKKDNVKWGKFDDDEELLRGQGHKNILEKYDEEVDYKNEVILLIIL